MTEIDYREESAIDRDDRIDYGYNKGGAIAEKAAVFAEEHAKNLANVRSGFDFKSGRNIEKDPFEMENPPIWVDTASFVWWAFYHSGISLGYLEQLSVKSLEHDPRLRQIYKYGQKSQAMFHKMNRGDLVWFNTVGNNSHVGIYVGRGRFIGCNGTGSKQESQTAGIVQMDMSGGYWWEVFKGCVKRLD